MVLTFRDRKNALKIARRLVSVFVEGLSLEERKQLTRKIVKKIKGSPGGRNYLLGGKATGYYNSLTGGILVMKIPGETKYTLTHEIVHALRKYVRNDLVLATGIETYFRFTDRVKNLRYLTTVHQDELLDIADVKISRPENLRPLTLIEKILGGPIEHSRGFSRTGNELGRIATWVEDGIGAEGSGLYFLKFIDEGFSLEDAEYKSRELHRYRDFKKLRFNKSVLHCLRGLQI